MPIINPPKPQPFVSRLSADQISAVEMAIGVLNPNDPIGAATDLARSAQVYVRELRQQDPDAGKRNLANLKQLNESAFNKVFAVLKPDQQAELTDYIAGLGGKIPEAQTIQMVSAVVGKIIGG